MNYFFASTPYYFAEFVLYLQKIIGFMKTKYVRYITFVALASIRFNKEHQIHRPYTEF